MQNDNEGGIGLDTVRYVDYIAAVKTIKIKTSIFSLTKKIGD